jgi:acyl homoserine lactone synthase
MKFLIKRRSYLSPDQISGIHQLRYNVFFNRLGWNVPTVGQEEVDEYDGLDPVFVTVFDEDKQVRACCRILPTTGSYMLRDTFPSLLGRNPCPDAENIWEISRFAVDKESGRRAGSSIIPSKMIALLVKHALIRRIEHYVFVTTVGIEKLLRRMNVNCERLSCCKKIGKNKCVAIWLHIDLVTIAAASSVVPELFRDANMTA